MELILIEEAPAKHRELSQEVSIATHKKHFAIDGVTILHGVKGPKMLLGALRCALEDLDISDNFIFSRDTTFVVAPFDPVQAHCHAKSAYLTRKGADTSAMVGSIGYLIDNGFTTYDYEVQVPQMMSKGLTLSTLNEIGDSVQHLKTTHFNRLGFMPCRCDDPKLDVWTWRWRPTSPIVTLSDTCFSHPDCLKWLKSLQEELVSA